MKKTILLLVTIVAVSTTFAQYGGDQQRGNSSHDVAVNTSKAYGYDRGTYFFSAKDKDMQIAQINSNYDQKIRSVKMKFFMSRFQKDKMIGQLQAQRSSEVSAVNAKFFDRKNLFNQQGKKFDDRRDDKRHNW